MKDSRCDRSGCILPPHDERVECHFDPKICPICREKRMQVRPTATAAPSVYFAPCCNPLCAGIWGTGCFHCHHPKFVFDRPEALVAILAQIRSDGVAVDLLRNLRNAIVDETRISKLSGRLSGCLSPSVADPFDAASKYLGMPVSNVDRIPQELLDKPREPQMKRVASGYNVIPVVGSDHFFPESCFDEAVAMYVAEREKWKARHS